MVGLPNTIVDLPYTMLDLPNTMVDLPNTMVDLPSIGIGLLRSYFKLTTLNKIKGSLSVEL